MPVLCPSCHSPALDAARFCAHCGSSLARSCGACGEALPAGAKFCPGCGAAAGESPKSETATFSEERRTISALFADLVGFTSHTEKSDPEDTRRRLSLYHGLVRQEVERFGGRVEKLMGDGVFAVFGSPVAHEDDPERAVRSALRVQQALHEVNVSQPHLALSVRIGVTTGEAIVQLDDAPDREGVVGDVVNTASRLQAVGAPGETIVDDRTYLAARGAIDFAPLEPVAVKGKEDRLVVWKATAAKSRFGVAVEEERASPFVGRAGELSLLTDSFDRAVARRRVQLVTVVGEPGVGKSRLLREFRRTIDDRPDLIWWRQGRCLPYGEGITFWAISEVVKAQAGILESEPQETVEAKLRETVFTLVEDPDEAEWIRLRLETLAGLDSSPAERSELFAAWTRFFEALAARNPLILLIEDLHWADDAVVDFLNHLVDWAHESPILILCTARPELFSKRPQWGGGKRDVTTLNLSPLSAEETVTLMSALSERPLMDAQLQAALVERSGGNPLYVTEFVRLAGERGWLEQLRQGRELPLPDNVAAIIAARLDLLSSQERSLLQAAAVIGRVFWTGALAVVEKLNVNDVQRVLQQLVARDLIRPVRRPSMQGQEEFVFSHVLARDAAYGRLTREDRVRLHEATARWLEAVSGERAVDVAELLAHHHLTALQLNPSPDEEQKHQVYRFLMLAGERTRGLDVSKATGFFRSAREVARTGLEQARTMIELGQLTIDDNDEQRRLFQGAMYEFVAAGDKLGEAEATEHLARHEWYRGNTAETDRWVAKGLELIKDLEPDPIVARVVVHGAAAAMLRGRSEEALELVENGLAIAQQVGSTENLARALSIRGSARGDLGDEAGSDDIMEALRIQLDRNDSIQAMSTFNNLATQQIRFGALRAGRQTIEEGIAYGTQRGLLAHVEWSRSTRIEALLPMADLDLVLSEASEMAANDVARGGSQVGVFAQFWVALVRFLRGETSGPLQTAEEVLQHAREIQDPQVLVPTLAAVVYFFEAAGERERARELAAEFIEASAEQPIFLVQNLDFVAQSMRRLGMVSELRRLVAEAPGYSASLKARVDLGRAALAEADGEYSQAVELIRGILKATDDNSDLFLGTRARIDGARNALLSDQQETATEWLGEAEAAARTMKAKRLVNQIDALRSEAPAAASGT